MGFRNIQEKLEKCFVNIIGMSSTITITFFITFVKKIHSESAAYQTQWVEILSERVHIYIHINQFFIKIPSIFPHCFRKMKFFVKSKWCFKRVITHCAPRDNRKNAMGWNPEFELAYSFLSISVFTRNSFNFQKIVS